MTKSLRPGKIFLDWSQNVAAKTTICPYSLRGRELPRVAAPRTWDEVEEGADGAKLRQLMFDEVLERLESDGDLLADLPLAALRAFRTWAPSGGTAGLPQPRAAGALAHARAARRSSSRTRAAAGPLAAAPGASGHRPHVVDHGQPLVCGRAAPAEVVADARARRRAVVPPARPQPLVQERRRHRDGR